jgi:hypothetical protein
MPTLRERIGNWIVGGRGSRLVRPRTAGAPIPFHPPAAHYFGAGIGTQPSHEILLSQNIGVADTATRAIANRIASLNPQVKISRQGPKGTLVDEILDDHPLKSLMDHPHPNYTGTQMRRLMGQYIVTVGEAYLLKVGSLLGVPLQLHPIPPWMIQPRMAGGVIESYTLMDGSGKPQEIEAARIVRCFLPDPESPWTSEGYLAPSGITADSLKFAGQHLRAHYQHDATPKTALESDVNASPFNDDEEEEFSTHWVQRYHQRRGQYVGVPALLPAGYKLIQLALQQGADIVPLLEYWSREQLRGMGVPRSVLGEVVSGDRSSAETTQYVFDRHTILPLATVIADSFTLQLAHDFDKSIYVEFEPFVSDDKRFLLEQEQSDLDRKVKAVNTILEARGEDTVEWGDGPIMKAGEILYEDYSDFMLPADDPSAIDDEDADEGEAEEADEPRVRATGSSTFFTPRAEWKRVLAHEKRYIPMFAREIRVIFRKQRDDVLDKLAEVEKPRVRMSPDDLFDADDERWGRLFALRVEPIRRGAYTAIATETLAGFGIEEFIMTEQMQLRLKQQGAQLVKHANRTTKRRITAALLEGTEEGESAGQIAKRIKRVFSERSRRHAITIARTELGEAASQAHLDSYELSGTERKRWHTNLDDAVRDSHQIEGQTRDLRDPFSLDDGELADAPKVGVGGAAMSAANKINCRCFMLPVVEA